MIHSIEECSHLKGMSVMVRSALNVPLENGKVSDPRRLELGLHTINFLLQNEAKVILISHVSEPMGSLRPVFEYLKTRLPVTFLDDTVGVKAHEAARSLKNGEVLLLENLRRNKGEEENEMQFAKELASLADIFVSDDFTVAHRKHAGVVTLPTLLPSYAGFQFMEEIDGLTPALSPESPSLAIMGGAKLVTKQRLLDSILSKYDQVFVGGAIVNDFYKAKGLEVGKSLISSGEEAKKLLSNSKIILPNIITVESPHGRDDKPADEVLENEIIQDISVEAIKELAPLIQRAKLILWNGPMGNFEKGFREGTDILAKMIADAPGRSIVGGGDTLFSIETLRLEEKFEFVSTAGGAMLDFLANGTLPGIEALQNSRII